MIQQLFILFNWIQIDYLSSLETVEVLSKNVPSAAFTSKQSRHSYLCRSCFVFEGLGHQTSWTCRRSSCHCELNGLSHWVDPRALETNSPPLRIGYPKRIQKEIHLPTIDFLGQCYFQGGYLPTSETDIRLNFLIDIWRNYPLKVMKNSSRFCRDLGKYSQKHPDNMGSYLFFFRGCFCYGTLLSFASCSLKSWRPHQVQVDSSGCEVSQISRLVFQPYRLEGLRWWTPHECHGCLHQLVWWSVRVSLLRLFGICLSQGNVGIHYYERTVLNPCGQKSPLCDVWDDEFDVDIVFLLN